MSHHSLQLCHGSTNLQAMMCPGSHALSSSDAGRQPVKTCYVTGMSVITQQIECESSK